MPALADLGLLHDVIQIVLDWGDDHLHVFTADGHQYGHPQLHGCTDETTVAIATVLRRTGATLDYRYDLGDCWDHTITLEKIVEGDGDGRPVLVGGRGDAPVEDWTPESPEESIPFDPDRINRRLRALRWTE